MKATNLPSEFTQALPVLESLESHGFEAYFVGGSVRDLLLNKAIHDVDIATSAYPEEVKNIFPRTIDVGIEHGTVLALVDDEQYEITTFRTESTYQDFRRPDQVTFVRSLSEDLKRRDFTINALAMDQTGTIIDLFQGMTDLEGQMIRAVGEPIERFTEDALRVMRGLRFSSQLGFQIESKTLSAIQEAAPLLAKISVERIHVELIKLLLAEKRNYGLQSFIETGAYHYCPGLKNREDALNKLLTINHESFEIESQAWLMLVYCLDISPDQVKKWLKEWKLSNHLIKEIQLLFEGLLSRLQQPLNNQSLFKYGKSMSLLIEKTLVFFEKKPDTSRVVSAYEALPIKSIQDLMVNGKDLMSALDLPAGPWLGQMLNIIKNHVLDGIVVNEKASLLQHAKLLNKTGGLSNDL